MGPILPDFKLAKGCPIALNRSHVLILSEEVHPHLTGLYCLSGWIYDFYKFQWIQRNFNNCYEFAQPSFEIDLTCTSIWDKNASM